MTITESLTAFRVLKFVMQVDLHGERGSLFFWVGGGGVGGWGSVGVCVCVCVCVCEGWLICSFQRGGVRIG